MKELDKISKWIKKNSHRDFSNKNIVITGSNSGIGFYLAAILVTKGANIIMPVRNMKKGEEARDKILLDCPNANITLMSLDLSSFRSIHAFVNEIISNKIDVDIFVNNAGVFHMPKSETKDGLELTIGTNHIGVKLLNDLLKDYFISLNHEVEVLFTSSVAAYRGKINYDDFYSNKHYNKIQVYSNSKLCVVHNYLDYSNNVKGTNIKTYLTHPGIAYSPLIKKAYPGIFGYIAMVFMKILFHQPPKACLSMFVALDKQKNNAYYGPRGLIEASGYPKELRIPKKLYKNIDKTIEISLETIRQIEQTIN